MVVVWENRVLYSRPGRHVHTFDMCVYHTRNIYKISKHDTDVALQQQYRRVWILAKSQDNTQLAKKT